MAYFNPYYNSNRYNSQSGDPQYTPYGYTNSYKPNNTSPQQIDYSKTMQVPGMSFNMGGDRNSQQQSQGTGEVENNVGQIGGSIANKSGMAGKIGGGVAIAANGLQTFESARTADNGFDVDSNAGLKGAASGAAAGSAAGPWGTLVGAIVGTVAGSVGSVAKVSKNAKALNTNVNGVSYDQDGKPIYNGQEILNAQTNSEAMTHGIHSVYDTPDITGTRWIGEALYNSRKTMRRKRAELDRNKLAAQNKYNTAETSANQQYIAQQDYQNSQNNTNRMYNLYN